MNSTWNFATVTNKLLPDYNNFNQWYSHNFTTNDKKIEKVTELSFRPISHAAMPEIWDFLQREFGRTTDFSYGGVLMWIDFFKYEYAIINDTLFIKGVVEDNRNETAFSLPIGKMNISDAINVLKSYCNKNNLPLTFSAIPEYAVEDFKQCSPLSIQKLEDWSDYLYDAESLAYLKGKKNSKKRNHVNQFVSACPKWQLIKMTSENADAAFSFMDKFDLEGDNTYMAKQERALTRFLIKCVKEGDPNLLGAYLTDGENICAFSIGDIKHDTFFVHVEKALRKYPGSYEMINKEFAALILETYPKIKYINREDDAGDEGLRKAKQSYHPLTMLEKYNIRF